MAEKAKPRRPQRGQERFDSAEDVEAAWRAELSRRLEDLRTGRAELLDWADARLIFEQSR